MSDNSAMISEKHQYAALLEQHNASAILSRAYQPMSWVHSEWVEKVLPNAYPTDTQCVKTNMFVSQALSIPNNFDLEVDSTLSKILLLDNHLIEKVIGLLGLCRYQKALKILISKQIKNEIDKQIGCDASDIVLRKLPFMLAKFPTELSSETETFSSVNVLPCFISEGMTLFKQLATSCSSYEFLRFALSPKYTVEETNITLSQATRDKTALLLRKLAIEVDRTCLNLLK